MRPNLILAILLLVTFKGSEFKVNALRRFFRPILLDPPPDSLTINARVLADQYFEQKIDNFNPTDTRTYRQVRISFFIT